MPQQIDSFIVHCTSWGTSNGRCWLCLHSGGDSIPSWLFFFIQQRHSKRGKRKARWSRTSARLSRNRYTTTSSNIKAALRQNRHTLLVPFFSWGVFRLLCWDYYLQRNRPTHLFRLRLRHRVVVRTLKFSGQALTLWALHLWFVSPFDSETFYLI